jgi:hypothetical protein
MRGHTETPLDPGWTLRAPRRVGPGQRGRRSRESTTLWVGAPRPESRRYARLHWLAVARELYSERAGQQRNLEVRDFMTLVWQAFKEMTAEGWFVEALGRGRTMFDPDAPEGRLRETDFIRVFKKTGILSALSPPGTYPPGWVENDVAMFFDVLEYVYSEATPEEKREDFRARVNPDLSLHDPPMEMTEAGLIVERGPDELHDVLAEPVPEDVPAELADPLRHAVEQYRRRGASEQDKRSALKNLADVLEPLRDEIDEYLLPADERALFELANKFYLRHNNREQQRQYDGDVWLDWMFYVYVATARALIAVLDRDKLKGLVRPDEPEDNGGLPL